MNLLTKEKQSPRLREKYNGCPGEDRVRDIYTLQRLKWITSLDLLYSTGTSAQCFVADWKGGEFGGSRYLYMYG